ncbi:RING-H2 zinc finger protein [Citrus sinensis]|uniref:Nudix hydrolase domain-containing protein n=2 Tax=Citrus TaxID=2706 RepID=A0A067E627_CITSI|nr:hypothetical protein CICLE_v10021557mg [Citrus x clementina]KAH9724427.1 RING-H2 zinc finger protein [Citrus sinensis]KDO46361.1 hypothetical protein CISIN_1g048617mg [Citrus sinensis]
MSPEPGPKPIQSSGSIKIINPPASILAAFSVLCLFTCSKPYNTTSTLKIPFLTFPSNPRRFLKIPIMSRTNHQLHHHSFATPQSLSDWLKPRLPSDSFASWGVKPGTKNVHNLWLELSDGETCLADAIPPVRTVNVVTVRIIGKDNQILVESHQELSDGSVRNRCRPLAEKMKSNETPEEAVIRAVKEELGSILNDSITVRIVPGSYSKKLDERNSLSYPGLPARYVLHSVDAFVDGLPEEGEFCTEEAEEYADSSAADKALFVKRHYWKWRRAMRELRID